ncbi:protein serine/threonine phosphatase 2C [Schizophyllum commune H4-8]|uniref:protein serine/threonine phosphatase 2C n=1 Tax=Schizophyllum commune (strain H4-8 / FGSC 9210) TaxID=578458 RepID=UPI00215E1123|nr:protein serine/threonine phosphatase 2C [Schizophyllum commune H4-8]KAI5888299.1 protein serine/threonine phosphatase 2C [Schizophyllum commune H4-8]
MCTRGIITIEAMGLEIHQSSLRGLKAASEDRISICESEFGVLIAIFDGHYTDELSSYAANVLPQQLCDRISRNISSGGGADISTAVEEALVKGIEDFDASLLDNVLKHFPQGADTDWDDPLWDDPAEVFDIFGYSREDPVFVAARRTIVGSTALVGFIDREKKNLWVASLGDSEAVLGRVVDDHLQCEVLNDLHNVDNPVEVARLQAEHLNEPPVVYNGRTMGKLAITRALGDFHLKVGLRLSTRVLSYAYPSYLGTNIIEDWQRRWNFHPPYISSTPTVHRHALLPGDVLLFASDGLRMSLEAVPIEDARTQAMVALAVTGNPSLKPVLTRLRDQLGHDFIPISQSTNSADFVIRNALFGADLNKMAAELALTGTSERYRDDISVVIVDLQG